ncbi:hypothetical protein H8A99_18470 [Bradyrhizobium sp. Arg68]|uniref:hypothetical protein n=1 Tax=Bradyrhizobium ivorense TaxID=2511166 RepID=UPI001E2B699F|nr:hypothetical protein [Bradyrhizobium ivorense]MCC8938405.1 hypothetical protein [Bradyrhizobium ivorense]
MALRDAKLVAAKADEMRLLLADAIGKFLEAQQAQMVQLEEIQKLKAEIAKFGDWEAEKQKYELKAIGSGAVAFMLKPAAREEQPRIGFAQHASRKKRSRISSFLRAAMRGTSIAARDATDTSLSPGCLIGSSLPLLSGPFRTCEWPSLPATQKPGAIVSAGRMPIHFK